MEPLHTYKGPMSASESFFGRSTIYGREGEHHTPYMTRYWIGRLRLHVFYRGDADPDPHDHPWEFWTFPLTSYVEEVMWAPVADAIRDGTSMASFPDPSNLISRQGVKRFRWHYRPATHCHRVLGRWSHLQMWTEQGDLIPDSAIMHYERHWRDDEGEEQIEIVPCKIVTIVWRGNTGRRWGFLKNKNDQWCWVPWKDYVFGGGKDAPCAPTAYAGLYPVTKIRFGSETISGRK